MSDATIFGKMVQHSIDEVFDLEMKLKAKGLEIDKRREVVETSSKTELAKKKDEAKIETLDTKIIAKVAGFDETIRYYHSEIEKAQTRRDDQLSLATKKCNEAIQRAQEIFDAAKRVAESHLETTTTKIDGQFETYRQYCQEAINQTNSKRDIVLAPFEKKKEQLQSQERSEDDDKVLVRLKVEQQQIKELLRAATEKKKTLELQQLAAVAEQQRNIQKQNQEEMERVRQIQQEKARAEAAAHNAMIEQDIKDRRERNQQRWEQEQREKEEKEREKNEASQNYTRFEKTIRPLLTNEELFVYTKLYNDFSSLAKDCRSLEDYPAIKDFLMFYKVDLEILKEFEENELKKLTKKEQDKYDDIQDYDTKIRLVKCKTKEKRREFLQKL